MKTIYIISIIAFASSASGLMAQETLPMQGGHKHDTLTVKDDPCIETPDLRYCWTLDPITGAVRPAVPDTSYLKLGDTDVMETKTMCMNYLGNLWSPAQSEDYFRRPDMHDFIFLSAYSLFAYSPEKQLYYNTRIPFTVATYLTSSSSLTSNDHLLLDFAGNFSKRLGIGTSLDYVYARGEYQFQGTKPLKWQTYLYYTGERYKAYLSANISYYGNQENGGISNRDYVLKPETFDSQFTEAENMPTNLIDTWNGISSNNVHFTHSYDAGFYRTEYDSDSAAYDQFVPVATFFHTIDYSHMSRSFEMKNDADAGDNAFFENNYIDSLVTNDQMGYSSFNTNVGIQLREGFNKYSQFGLTAFLGYEMQQYTNMVDSTDFSYIKNRHTSHNVWVGGQLSRHLNSLLTFDVTARTCLTGDKAGDVDLQGYIQTVIPTGRGEKKDSLIIHAGGSLQNNRVSYLMDHFFSNHFKWNNDFDREQHVRLQGNITYPHSGTSVNAGIEHINNYHYFTSAGLPAQYDKQIDIFSLEVQQKLKTGIFHFDNSIMFQTSTSEDVLSLPKFSIQSDLYLQFRIAKSLYTQMGISAYYYTKYYAPNYQPATQMFCVQNDIECGNFPVFNAYANCHLKRIRFFVQMYNMLDKTFGNDVFISPNYPIMPRRFEWGVSLDLQN